jgi:murein DD-endopeptidase MepM/ murein hydrolase activator NlpD
VAILGVAAAFALSLAPASVLADDSPPPVVATSPDAIPSASPTAEPAPASSASPAPSASSGPAPKATPVPPSQVLHNQAAQSELIGDLTAAEAHALMLENSVRQSELGLIALGQQILDSEKHVSDLDARIDAVTAQHQQVSARLQADRTELATIVRRLYKHQDNFFVSLVRSGGFGGLLRVIGYSDVIVDRERDLVRSVQADDVALQHTQTTLERSRASKKDELSKLVQIRSTLAQTISTGQALQAQLQSTIEEALSALDAMQTDSPEMAARRARLVKMKTDSVLAQIEQAVFTQQNVQQTANLVAVDPILLSTGRLLWPIPHASITQGFGPTPYTFEAAYAGFPHFHTGIDLSVPLGTPVFAAADGVVLLAQPMTDASGGLVGYGNYIVIQHETGLKTLYGHLLVFGVKAGDVVKRGQLVGLVGSTGNSTGPHTHFEVRIENSPVDPMQMMPSLTPNSETTP